MHLAPTVREAIGPYPAGLGRPAAHLFAGVPDVRLAPVLQSLGTTRGRPTARRRRRGRRARRPATACSNWYGPPTRPSRRSSSSLAGGPPIGRVRQTQLMPAGEQPTPPQRLVARGLLVQIDSQTVELPREVGLALRGEQSIAVQTDPAPILTVDRTPAELDRLGTTAVLARPAAHRDPRRLVVGRASPANCARAASASGSLRRTARDLGCDEPTAALIAETAQAAGLIGDDQRPRAGLPAHARVRQLAPRTAGRAGGPAVASAWLAMTRQPSLVNQRGERERVITALGPDAERGMIPALRSTVLATIAALPPGSAPAIARDGPGPAQLAGTASRRCPTRRQPRRSWPRPTSSASPPRAGSPATAAPCSTAAAPSPSRCSTAPCPSRSTTCSSSRTSP